MYTFDFTSIDEGYVPILRAILQHGEKTKPRGKETLELSPVAITFSEPTKNVISNKKRKLNYAYMIANTLWTMQGRNDVDSIIRYNHNLADYSDDNNVFSGAYGQRIFRYDGLFDVEDKTYIDSEGATHPDFDLQQIIINQFDNAYNVLKADKNSRQAIINIYNPVQDQRIEVKSISKDVPCTCMIQFLQRGKKLNMIVTMRSNDAYLGMPYDLFLFSTLQRIMAMRLNIKVGTYTHIANSLHIYKDKIDTVKEIIDNANVSVYNDIDMIDATMPEESIADVYNVEASTRSLGKLITLEKVESLLYVIKNEYWRSIAAVIAYYNFKIDGRDKSELDIIHNYISNEFADLI